MNERQPTADTTFEDYPLTRSEYISAMVHFYRGELGRADAARARLDPTTNWAVVTAGAVFSFAFRTDNSHVTLLLALLLISIFLGFEARRFRHFDCWRSRVRMIEENFWIPMIRRNLVSPRTDWREFVAEDLDRPKFKITFLEAIGIRLRFNYLWIYLAILVAWLIKVHIHPANAPDISTLFERMAIGPIGGISVFTSVVVFYVLAVSLAIWAGHRIVDEVHGLERSTQQWKT